MTSAEILGDPHRGTDLDQVSLYNNYKETHII
jgi:hypothetical protein